MRYKKNLIYQLGTINSLIHGISQGEINLAQLSQHGDFGIGTYNHMAGEMVLLDNIFYQIGKNGLVCKARSSMKTPFAIVTFFHQNQSFHSKEKQTLKQLETFIDSKIISKNLIYGIKITGDFSHMQLRAMKKQPIKHPLLSKNAQYQYSLNSSSGTLIGFRFPSFMKNVNVPGYHFHFIDIDKKRGGHLFKCVSHKVRVEISIVSHFHLELLQTKKFLQANLLTNKSKEIAQLERGK